MKYYYAFPSFEMQGRREAERKLNLADMLVSSINSTTPCRHKRSRSWTPYLNNFQHVGRNIHSHYWLRNPGKWRWLSSRQTLRFRSATRALELLQWGGEFCLAQAKTRQSSFQIRSCSHSKEGRSQPIHPISSEIRSTPLPRGFDRSTRQTRRCHLGRRYRCHWHGPDLRHWETPGSSCTLCGEELRVIRSVWCNCADARNRKTNHGFRARYRTRDRKMIPSSISPFFSIFLCLICSYPRTIDEKPIPP